MIENTFPNGIDVKDVRVYDLTKEPEYGVIEPLERLVEYIGKWAQMYFHKSGKTYKTNDKYDTEAESLADIKDTFNNPRWVAISFVSYGVREIPISELSHGIPFPTGDT